MDESKINIQIIKSLYKNKGIIILSTIGFAVIMMVASLFFTNKYVAHGTVYPTSSNSMADILSEPKFGFEFNANKLIQMFYSDGMKQLIINKFDLIEYFDIDTLDPEWYGLLEEKYYKNIVLERTFYSSVDIKVTMRDPKMAADIVNTMIDNVDSIRTSLLKQNVIVYEKDLAAKLITQKSKVDGLLKDITALPQTQLSNNLSKNSTATIAERIQSGTLLYGDNIVINALQNQYSLETEQKINEYYSELGNYNLLLKEYSLAKTKLTEPIPGIYEVERARPSSQKSNYSIYEFALIGLVVGLLISVSLVAFVEKWNQIKGFIKE